MSKRTRRDTPPGSGQVPPLDDSMSFVYFLLLVGVLVVIHEQGHFITARLARIRVHEFGIGFPPRAKVLCSHGETLYTLNWLPIRFNPVPLV